VLLFYSLFLFSSTAKAQNNYDSRFYVSDNTLFVGKDQVFITSNLKINKQKIYVDVNTIFYDSGVVSLDFEYINNNQKNISKKTIKQLSLAQNYKNKKLKEKLSKEINLSSNSDNFPIGRKKINISCSAFSSITYSNSNKKSSTVGLNNFNFENLLITKSNNKYNFQNYDKVINCFKTNLKLFNRPPPNII
jgi:hypothetical protein